RRFGNLRYSRLGSLRYWPAAFLLSASRHFLAKVSIRKISLKRFHRLDQSGNVLQLRARSDTVAQIENVPRTTAHGFQNRSGFARHDIRRCVTQERRSEISLQCDVLGNDG